MQPIPTLQHAAVRYGMAVLCVAVGLLVRSLLDPFVGNHAPFTAFYVAVVAAAWYGGFGPALVAIVLGLLAADYFFIEPRYVFGFHLPHHLVAFAGYVLVGLAIATFSEVTRSALQRAEENAQKAHRKRGLLEQEIAQRKRLQDEVEQRAAELAQADQRKDEALAVMAHEMRNALTPLSNGLQVLRLTGGNGAEAGKALRLLENQASLLVRLVEDILDVSRVRLGKVKFQRMPVELADVLAQAIESSRPLIEARKHELAVSWLDELICLEADFSRLVQVFANLLTNAAKYTPEGGHVWLSVERLREEVLVRVRDDGVGISPDMMPRLFGLFEQAEGSKKQSQGGLGIGLALVKSLVELHGGKVGVRSDGLGQGSEFVVRLPVVSASG